MKRTSLFVSIAFLAGLSIAFLARSTSMGMFPQKDTRAADLAAIEKLHKEDIEVTLSQEPKGLMDIWSADAVRFNPGSAPAVGKSAIAAENEKVHSQHPGFKVLSYVPKYRDIEINGELACEWFEREGEYKLSADSPSSKWQAKGLQVLKRQSDGSWKFLMLFMSQ